MARETSRVSGVPEVARRAGFAYAVRCEGACGCCQVEAVEIAVPSSSFVTYQTAKAARNESISP
jgi:ferredoxin